MSVRTRFAPSPTGNLHIGGARTAIYSHLFAQKEGGVSILRIEDTDRERSKPEFETALVEDLNWLGFEFNESPSKGELGPYRQSERSEIYQRIAKAMLEKGLAFYDFCTEAELEEMKRANQEEGAPAYTGKWKDAAHWDEAKAKVAAGEAAPIRFLAPEKNFSFDDKVRGTVTFPANMMSDFVILRSTGAPVYNFCCVIDDLLMRVTHVIRGEDHVNNTLKQLMIYEGLSKITETLKEVGYEGEVKPPTFAHVSLLIGEDRQKLSKRHGATSVGEFKRLGFLPEALCNYLCLLGWSHPEEKDLFTLEEIKHVFNLDRFSKAPAVYDMEKLKFINAHHLRNLPMEKLIAHTKDYLPEGHFFLSKEREWQEKCLELFKEKIQMITELPEMLNRFLESSDLSHVDEGNQEIAQAETTGKLREFYLGKVQGYEADFISTEDIGVWMNEAKKELGIKGKPLFMGSRIALTKHDYGPDLKTLVTLTPKALLMERLKA